LYVLHILCVFVALGIQHAMRMRHIVMWPVRLYSTIQHYLINGTFSEKKKKDVNEYKMCILIFSATFVWNICHYKINWARY